jgi:hypothetical protein
MGGDTRHVGGSQWSERRAIRAEGEIIAAPANSQAALQVESAMGVNARSGFTTRRSLPIAPVNPGRLKCLARRRLYTFTPIFDLVVKSKKERMKGKKCAVAGLRLQILTDLAWDVKPA